MTVCSRAKWRRRPVVPGFLAVMIIGLFTTAIGLEISRLSSRPVLQGAGPNGGSSMLDNDDPDIGPTNPDEVIDFSVVLHKPRSEDLRAFLTSLHDPASRHYRQFLTPDEFGRQFGVSAPEVARVESWLLGRGFEVVSSPPQRTSLGVRGSARNINAAFAITLRDRLGPLGRRYHTPDREPTMPGPLRALVDAVALNSRGPDPATSPIVAAIPDGRLLPGDIARAYEIDDLWADGLHGEGQSIGIVSFDTFLDADVTAFDGEAGTEQIAGAPPPDVLRVRLPGALTEPGDGSSEVNLDIDVIRAIAPQAQIINYEAPNGPFGPVIREIVSRGEVEIVSISWGYCERELDATERLADDAEFDAAAAIGISIFVASGDHGAYGCRFWPLPTDAPRFRDLGLSIDYPSANPSLISVGGTYLSVRTDGTYLDEAGWEDALTGWATGGGVSLFHDRPAWQSGLGVENAFSTGMRQVPDVAGPADSDSGFLVVWTPSGETQGTYTFGGTSASAPFWAASMVLARQLAEREGVDAPGFGVLGSLGPLLYDLASASQPGELFHDVIRGGNLYHNATAGWDYATGLGTPRVGPLARAIVDSLR